MPQQLEISKSLLLAKTEINHFLNTIDFLVTFYKDKLRTLPVFAQHFINGTEKIKTLQQDFLDTKHPLNLFFFNQAPIFQKIQAEIIQLRQDMLAQFLTMIIEQQYILNQLIQSINEKPTLAIRHAQAEISLRHPQAEISQIAIAMENIRKYNFRIFQLEIQERLEKFDGDFNIEHRFFAADRRRLKQFISYKKYVQRISMAKEFLIAQNNITFKLSSLGQNAQVTDAEDDTMHSEILVYKSVLNEQFNLLKAIFTLFDPVNGLLSVCERIRIAKEKIANTPFFPLNFPKQTLDPALRRRVKNLSANKLMELRENRDKYFVKLKQEDAATRFLNSPLNNVDSFKLMELQDNRDKYLVKPEQEDAVTRFLNSPLNNVDSF